MTEGAYCKHGVNYFNPDGCPHCAHEHALRQPVKEANGVGANHGPGRALDARVKKITQTEEGSAP